jgi:hypothetical protein
VAVVRVDERLATREGTEESTSSILSQQRRFFIESCPHQKLRSVNVDMGRAK